MGTHSRPVCTLKGIAVSEYIGNILGMNREYIRIVEEICIGIVLIFRRFACTFVGFALQYLY